MSGRHRASGEDGKAAEPAARAGLGALLGRALPLIVPTGLAVWSLVGGNTVRAVVFGAIAALVLLLTLSGVRIDRAVERFAVAVEAVLGFVLATIAGVVVVAAGLFSMMAGHDPLSDGRARRVGWTPVDAGPTSTFARRPFGPAGPRRGPIRTALRIVGVALMVVGLGALALPAARAVHRWISPDDRQGPPIEFPSYAFPDEPWVAELHDAGWPVGFHPSLGWQSTDVRTRYLNVEAGVRTSWEAQDGGGPVIWFLGGSTLYGLGQRDDHTIPSEVARIAADAGRPIRAVNLGVPGYNQWQEIALMANRLSRGERPDLIVIYDGANDLTSMEYRAQEGIEPLDEPPNRFHEAVEQQTRYRPEPRSGTAASETELRDAFVEMYGAGLDLARRTAAAYDVPIELYWQPTATTSERTTHDVGLLRDEPDLADDRTVARRARNRDLVDRLRPGIVDLSGALDDAPGAVYFDPVHTNELGAQLVAAAMWPTIRDAVGP